MKVAIGSDHRGFEAKQQIQAIITQMGHECIDFGTDGTHPVDYPDLAFVVASAVSAVETWLRASSPWAVEAKPRSSSRKVRAAWART